MPARVVAGMACILFLVFMVTEWLKVDRGTPSLRTLLEPSILLCIGGSILCFFVAAGSIGTHSARARASDVINNEPNAEKPGAKPEPRSTPPRA